MTAPEPEPRPRRRYRRLTGPEEIELRSLWEGGSFTMDDLAGRLGMSRRGVQAALDRLGARKGATAPAASLLRPVRAKPCTPPADPEERARDAKAAVYANAVRLEALAMQAAEDASELGGIAALRAIDLAASVLARTRVARWASLGLDGKTPAEASELPELPVRQLTDEETEAIRAAQAAEDEAFGVTYDQDEAAQDDADIVEEGGAGPPSP